jgi:hypothetical protein
MRALFGHFFVTVTMTTFHSYRAFGFVCDSFLCIQSNVLFLIWWTP